MSSESLTYTEKYGVSYHLAICRVCNELCMGMFCTKEEYDAWWARHKDHSIEKSPEVPVGGVYVRKRGGDR